MKRPQASGGELGLGRKVGLIVCLFVCLFALFVFDLDAERDADSDAESANKTKITQRNLKTPTKTPTNKRKKKKKSNQKKSKNGDMADSSTTDMQSRHVRNESTSNQDAEDDQVLSMNSSFHHGKSLPGGLAWDVKQTNKQINRQNKQKSRLVRESGGLGLI